MYINFWQKKIGYSKLNTHESILALPLFVSQPASRIYHSQQISIHQPAIFFSYNKSAPATSHSQLNRAESMHLTSFDIFFPKLGTRPRSFIGIVVTIAVYNITLDTATSRSYIFEEPSRSFIEVLHL
jgi:hypothetical protein